MNGFKQVLIAYLATISYLDKLDPNQAKGYAWQLSSEW